MWRGEGRQNSWGRGVSILETSLMCSLLFAMCLGFICRKKLISSTFRSAEKHRYCCTIFVGDLKCAVIHTRTIVLSLVPVFLSTAERGIEKH
jgi:hypothetical protein